MSADEPLVQPPAYDFKVTFGGTVVGVPESVLRQRLMQLALPMDIAMTLRGPITIEVHPSLGPKLTL